MCANGTQRTEFMEAQRPAGYLVTEQRAGEAADAFTGIPSVVHRNHVMRRTHGGGFEGERERTGKSRQRAGARGAFSAAGVMLEMRFTRRDYLTRTVGDREREKEESRSV